MLNKVDGNTVPINLDVRLKIEDWLSKSVAPTVPLNNPFPRGLEFFYSLFNCLLQPFFLPNKSSL